MSLLNLKIVAPTPTKTMGKPIWKPFHWEAMGSPFILPDSHFFTPNKKREIKMPENELTFEYFMEEYHRFRKELCSRNNTIDQKLKMFQGLVYVYFNVKKLDEKTEERMQVMMEALKIEVDMRLGYEALAEIYSIPARV